MTRLSWLVLSLSLSPSLLLCFYLFISVSRSLCCFPFFLFQFSFISNSSCGALVLVVRARVRTRLSDSVRFALPFSTGPSVSMVCETPFLGLVSPFDSFLFLRAVHFSCIEWWREGSDADARIATHLMAARPSHRRLRLSDLLAVRISAELLALQNTYGPCTSFLFQVHTCKYKHTLSHTHREAT